MIRPRSIAAAVLLASASAPAVTAQDAPPTPDLTHASRYFAEIEDACERNEAERLWGVPICGPILLVDARTRRVAANRPDPEGRLTAAGGVWVGDLPTRQLLANAPVEWAGVRWAMVIVQFLAMDRPGRVTLLTHESFHRVQPGLDLYPMAEEAAHLDEPDGRYWMKLEWNALETALAGQGAERERAIEDALAFRATRRSAFPEAGPRERAVEIREGLAQYTGLRVAGRRAQGALEDVRARRAREDGIVRSFGYNSGPLYGFLLDDADPTWRQGVSPESDLGTLLGTATGILPDASIAGRRAERYGGADLRAAEDARAEERERRLAEWRASLVEGPVLVLDLSKVSSGAMDTRAVFPFAEGKTVYTVRRLVAEWGILEVSGAAILEDRTTGEGRISLAGADEDGLSGPGWSLELADGWSVVEGARPGDLRLEPPG